MRENAGAAATFNYQQQQQGGDERIEKDKLKWIDLTVGDLLDKDGLKLAVSVWDHYQIRCVRSCDDGDDNGDGEMVLLLLL